MPKYRKKPVVIEAMQVTKDVVRNRKIQEWAESCTDDGDVIPVVNKTATVGMLIHTLEGTMHATPGDYVIRGVQGEFYPCKPDIFEATYEREH